MSRRQITRPENYIKREGMTFCGKISQKAFPRKKWGSWGAMHCQKLGMTYYQWRWGCFLLLLFGLGFLKGGGVWGFVLFLFDFLSETVSCTPGWLQTPQVARAGLELILLLSLAKRWDPDTILPLTDTILFCFVLFFLGGTAELSSVVPFIKIEQIGTC